MTSTPPSFALSMGDDDQDHKYARKSKCECLVVALCPCLFCLILLFIVLSIFLTLKFHIFCHTPLGSIIYKKKC